MNLLDPGLSVGFTCNKEKTEGQILFFGWGHGDVVALLDNHMLPEKKEDIKPSESRPS
jgi:hypothetical protein